jgi:dipeptidase D
MRNLQPQKLWNFFYQITQIPRPSKKEEKIITYLIDYAKSQNLSFAQDSSGNLLIKKPATVGYENQPTVILQAHVDMVCEKNADSTHNFDTDPIEAYIDGDWVKAKGTTLGADNGIGVAMMLAILDSDDLRHPALECLFTVDEETGLTGAYGLAKDFLSGSILINLDSEEDGEVFIGCAGGIGTKAFFFFEREATPSGYFGFTISVSGLSGGHSGGDIHLGRANANKVLNRYLWELNQQMDLRLYSFNGGNLHNAIPREATALCAAPHAEKEKVRVMLNMYVSALEERYQGIEPNLQIDLESEALPASVMTKSFSDRFLNMLYACPHGVKAMSRDIPGLVETSTNLASVKMKADNLIEVNTSQRSSSNDGKTDIANQVCAALTLGGAKVKQSDGYPGWQPNKNSAILKKASAAYEKLFGKTPIQTAIHAGLECGLFLEKYPHLDMISMGPQMYDVHSPDERVSISSTEKSWKWLIEILASLHA